MAGPRRVVVTPRDGSAIGSPVSGTARARRCRRDRSPWPGKSLATLLEWRWNIFTVRPTGRCGRPCRLPRSPSTSPPPVITSRLGGPPLHHRRTRAPCCSRSPLSSSLQMKSPTTRQCSFTPTRPSPGTHRYRSDPRSRSPGESIGSASVAASTAGDAVLESASTFLLGAQPAGLHPEPRTEPVVDERAGWGHGPWEADATSISTIRSASRLDLVKYAGASGDFNPIHFDHDAATGAGLEGIVAHGLLMGAWILDAASALRAGDHPFTKVKMRFREPLLAAQRATLEGSLRDGGTEADVRLLRAHDDTPLVTALVHLAPALRTHEE